MRQQRDNEHERYGCQAIIDSQNKAPARGSALQPAAPASPTVKIGKQSHPVEF
jgi:hypothetical protein